MLVYRKFSISKLDDVNPKLDEFREQAHASAGVFCARWRNLHAEEITPEHGGVNTMTDVKPAEHSPRATWLTRHR